MVKSPLALTQLEINKILKKMLYFISDISFVRYNIRLTSMGYRATFLYSGLAHKEANQQHLLSAYLLGEPTLKPLLQIYSTFK